MRNTCIGLIAAMLLSGCAQAQPRPPKAIPDVEPEVTQQVGALLSGLAEGALAQEQLTDNLRAALDASQLRQMGAALRPCPRPPAMELLERKTKGEDRQYLYRALCGNTPLLVEIDFNKAARINRLVVRAE